MRPSSGPPTRRSSDYLLLLAIRACRAFGFGVSAVLIGMFLRDRGLSAGLIGLTLSLGLFVGSLSSIGLALLASRVGRRSSLALSGLLMAVAGLDLAFAAPAWLLVLAGGTGMLGAASIDLGPFAAVEQALLAESVAPSRRNVAFARYAMAGALAAAGGSLAATLGTDTVHLQLLFLLYAALGVATAMLPWRLSEAVEAPAPGPILHRENVKPIAGLSALFALDAFGGGFVVTAVIAYWLAVRYGAGSGVLGPAFAAMALVQALSYEVSGRLANRVGLVRTMVITHLPSNVLLVLVPFSPSLPVAVALLIARFSISQMDVPARQAYVVSIVSPAERAGASAVTNAVRGVAQAFGPVLAGMAIQGAAVGLPFVIAGGIKGVYDVALYRAFRHRRGEHEMPRDPVAAAQPPG